MKASSLLLILIAILSFGCSPKAGPRTHYYKKDGVHLKRSKIYGYPDGKRKLAQVQIWKVVGKNRSLLQERTIYYELWPVGGWKFVSKKGFTVFKDGKNLLLNDSMVVPDNIIHTSVDKNYKEKIEVYKDGKRIPFTLGRPDGHESIQLMADTPGVYVWKDGKEYLKRELTSEEIFGYKIKAEQWKELAIDNKRLLPKYGYQQKTSEEQTADLEFVKAVLEKDSNRRNASDQLIKVGFEYLYKDKQTAMYRFNQAYLIDSSNTDIYWGFGAVYFALGDYKNAKKQFREGLTLDPKNTHLLTDYGTCFLGEFYFNEHFIKLQPLRSLDSAVIYLKQSYEIDPQDQNTSFKLSVCYYNQNDCKNAWKYYDLCKALGGVPITESYREDLRERCRRRR